jgi:hypothetical protein
MPNYQVFEKAMSAENRLQELKLSFEYGVIAESHPFEDLFIRCLPKTNHLRHPNIQISSRKVVRAAIVKIPTLEKLSICF